MHWTNKNMFSQNSTKYRVWWLRKIRGKIDLGCVTFVSLWPNTWQKQFKGENLFWLMVSDGSIQGGLAHMLGQNILVVGVWGKKLFTSWLAGSRERIQEGTGERYSPKNTPSVLCFLQLEFISYYLLTPSYYQSIEGLIHSLGQSPQDAITSQKLISWQPSSQNMRLQGTFPIPTKQGSNHGSAIY
jgi:hypothetical protein